MDLVCRKLDLRPGERVVQAGCGWGALALHMARRFGVEVTACNLSSDQVAWARRRAEQEGLAGRAILGSPWLVCRLVLDRWFLHSADPTVRGPAVRPAPDLP